MTIRACYEKCLICFFHNFLPGKAAFTGSNFLVVHWLEKTRILFIDLPLSDSRETFFSSAIHCRAIWRCKFYWCRAGSMAAGRFELSVQTVPIAFTSEFGGSRR